MQTLKQLDAADFGEWARHVNRQNAESGHDGRPLSSPLTGGADYATSERRARFETSIVIPVGTAGWMRCWGLVGDQGAIVGHLDLSASTIVSEQHRVSLGIGLESAYYRQGFGRALMNHAIGFAQDHGIEWIDLQVLAENTPAMALYKSTGFIESGHKVDRFRINGRSVDDVMMTLKLSALPVPNAPAARLPDPTPRSRRS